MASGSGRIRWRSAASLTETTARVVRCLRWLTRPHHASSWNWNSSWFGEPPPGLEVAVQKPVVALERPLGLAVARVEEDPAHGEPAAEGGELVGRAAVPGVERALTVPDELLRQRPEPVKAAAHAQAMSQNSFEKTGAPQKPRE
jgi:hypothetical protein